MNNHLHFCPVHQAEWNQPEYRRLGQSCYWPYLMMCAPCNVKQPSQPKVWRNKAGKIIGRMEIG